MDTQLIRVADADGEPAVRFRFEAAVACKQCGIRFRFMGLPHGLSYETAAVSEDAEILRAPIEPAYVRELLGVPETYGNA